MQRDIWLCVKLKWKPCFCTQFDPPSRATGHPAWFILVSLLKWLFMSQDASIITFLNRHVKLACLTPLFIIPQADTFIRPQGIRGTNGSFFIAVGQTFTHLRQLDVVSLSDVVMFFSWMPLFHQSENVLKVSLLWIIVKVPLIHSTIFLCFWVD